LDTASGARLQLILLTLRKSGSPKVKEGQWNIGCHQHLLNSNVQIDLVIFMYNCTCIYVFHTCMYLVSKLLLTCFNWKYNSIMFVYKHIHHLNNLELSLLFLFGERPCNSTQLLWSISGWLLTSLGNIQRFFFSKVNVASIFCWGVKYISYNLHCFEFDENSGLCQNHVFIKLVNRVQRHGFIYAYCSIQIFWTDFHKLTHHN